MLLSRSILVFWIGLACAYAGRAQSDVARSVEGSDPEVAFAYISKIKAGEPIPATPGTFSKQVPAYKYAAARHVFDALVEAKGNRAMQRPDLVMSKSVLFVAWMDPKRLAIGLEEKAYDVCAGFGADSLNALAAILGHELTHYYEKHDWKAPSLPSGTKSTLGMVAGAGPESIKQEEQADYLGGFLAYAAGFNAVGIIPQFLGKVYQAYGLPENLDGYTTLPERVALANQSFRRAQELVYMFETAGYLVALEKYDEARHYYKAILKTFQSREIYNNAGISLLMSALESFSNSELRFAYPVELDPEPRLNVIVGTRASKPQQDIPKLSQHEIEEREQLLLDAIRFFEQAGTLDQHYPAAMLNKACALELLQLHREARFWAQEAHVVAKPPQQQQVKADALNLLGIIAANQLDSASASHYFDAAVDAGSRRAAANRNLLTRNKTTKRAGSDFVEFVQADSPLSRSPGDYIEMEEPIDGVRLREPTPELVFDSLIEIINDPARQLSAILGVKTFEQSLLLAASYQSELTLETADTSFFVLSSTVLLLHRTAANYAGQSQKGVKIGDTLDQVLKKFWKPQRTIHLTQGDLLVYNWACLIFHIDGEGKVKGWVSFWEKK